jgi:hypothetical protein
VTELATPLQEMVNTVETAGATDCAQSAAFVPDQGSYSGDADAVQGGAPFHAIVEYPPAAYRVGFREMLGAAARLARGGSALKLAMRGTAMHVMANNALATGKE